MSFTAVRDALVALSPTPGAWCTVADIAAECARRGTPLSSDAVAAELGTMHDFGLATKNGQEARWDGLIVLAPSGDRAALYSPDRYPLQHLEDKRIEIPHLVHFYVVPVIR